MAERIAVIGLGYVGLPVALACARKFSDTIGFDVDARRVSALQQGIDTTGETAPDELRASKLRITSAPGELGDRTFFIVAVPTPVDKNNRPDLGAITRASETVGRALKPGSVVVYESTVYPGLTEEICGPILARVSGLKQGVDFHLGYSPERINPGDREHSLERIVKVVAGDDAQTLARVAAVYAAFVTAGVHRASSIKVAEAAKVLENTQRDLNIALMNELAMICERLNIATRDVLAAAATKWNFLPFKPGLVGGHCIGVDPYYLTTKAEELGYLPQVILAGRRINDNMGVYVAQRVVKMLVNADAHIKGARVGILGITFKENVRDIRNSRVPDIARELKQFGIDAMIHDPLVDAAEVKHEYGLVLSSRAELRDLDALILAVPHAVFLQEAREALLSGLKKSGVLADIKSALDPALVPSQLRYWSL
ncbi:MAG: nucleotide sugar dehydrogenase [Deltaproteobacteria bacterium]|nr:nucleotide sugar dehydrogenase [Deltaproteobacteria bacterium]